MVWMIIFCISGIFLPFWRQDQEPVEIWGEAFRPSILGKKWYCLKEPDHQFKQIKISSIKLSCDIFSALIALHKTQENLYKNVNENMFSFTFLCKFSWICNFAIFASIFMKFPPKCRTKKFGMIYTILASFCSFLNWEGTDIRPQIRLGITLYIKVCFTSLRITQTGTIREHI